MTDVLAKPLKPGDRFKFANFHRIYRVLDWRSVANTLELLYGPFHIVPVEGEPRLLDNLLKEKGLWGFAMDEEGGNILPLKGTEEIEVCDE